MLKKSLMVSGLVCMITWTVGMLYAIKIMKLSGELMDEIKESE